MITRGSQRSSALRTSTAIACAELASVPGEDVVVDAAAELRAHRPFAGAVREDEPHRLLDLALARDERDAAGRVGAQREPPPGSYEIVTVGHNFTR